jgi:hypothetical protein
MSGRLGFGLVVASRVCVGMGGVEDGDSGLPQSGIHPLASARTEGAPGVEEGDLGLRWSVLAVYYAGTCCSVMPPPATRQCASIPPTVSPNFHQPATS